MLASPVIEVDECNVGLDDPWPDEYLTFHVASGKRYRLIRPATGQPTAAPR